jgi:hypothetical protein
MKRTSVSFTDDISALNPLTYLSGAIGEEKIMEAEYTLADTCLTMDNSVVTYDFALGLAMPRKPTTANYFRITVTSALAVGTWYDMQLLVDGSGQGQPYYASKNSDVQFKKLTDRTFAIRHRFKVTDDVNGFIGENGINNYGYWFGIPDLQAPTIATSGTGTSMYDATKYFVTHLTVIDIADQVVDQLIEYDKIVASFFDTSALANTFQVTLPTTDYVIGDATPTRVTFTNVNALNIPTHAKLLLVNRSPTDTNTTFDPAIIEDDKNATIINVAGSTWRIDANLTALTEYPKDIIAIVYYNALDSVASSKIGTFPPRPNGPITAIRGCYPTITTNYGDYNSTIIGSCINSVLFERVEAKFIVSKSAFNKIGLGGGCFPLGFDQYNKTGTFELKQRSTGVVQFTENFSYNASSGVWSVGSLTFTDALGFLNFSFVYRNLIGYLGDNIDATFTFNIWYSATYYETVVSQSTNFVSNFDQSNALTSIINSVEILNFDTLATIDSMIGNIMTINPSCDRIFKVKVCRNASTLGSNYNIIPVLYQVGSNSISEEDSYIDSLAQLSSPYFSGVPSSFGIGIACATFELDMTLLDPSIEWEIAVIIKKTP